MINMSKFELKKLFKAKIFYTCIFITILLSIFTAMSGLESNINVNGKMSILQTMIPGSGIDLLIAVLVPIMVCNDFANGAIRLILGRGYSRGELCISKYIMAVISTVILSLVCVITGLVTVNISKVSGEIYNERFVLVLLMEILVMLVITTLVFAFSLMFQKKSIAIVVSIFTPSIIALVIGMVDSLMKDAKNELSDYWVASFLTQLSSAGTENIMYGRIVMCSFIYTIVFAFLGYYFVRKKDM